MICQAATRKRPCDQAADSAQDTGGVMAWPIEAPAPGVTEPAGGFRDRLEHQGQFRPVPPSVTGRIVLPNQRRTTIARGSLDSADTTPRSRWRAEAPCGRGGQAAPRPVPAAADDSPSPSTTRLAYGPRGGPGASPWGASWPMGIGPLTTATAPRPWPMLRSRVALAVGLPRPPGLRTVSVKHP